MTIQESVIDRVAYGPNTKPEKTYYLNTDFEYIGIDRFIGHIFKKHIDANFTYRQTNIFLERKIKSDNIPALLIPSFSKAKGNYFQIILLFSSTTKTPDFLNRSSIFGHKIEVIKL
jgi:hypothetical protein